MRSGTQREYSGLGQAESFNYQAAAQRVCTAVYGVARILSLSGSNYNTSNMQGMVWGKPERGSAQNGIWKCDGDDS